MDTAAKADTDVWPDGNDFWASRIFRTLKSDVQVKFVMYLKVEESMSFCEFH